MQVKDVTSTSFGLLIAFLLPGVVGLFSLTFWFASAARVFETFLTAQSSIGLFLLVLVGAVTLGLVISAVRWLAYEVLLAHIQGIYGEALTKEERASLFTGERLTAFRATIDETYRYHQFFGGLAIAIPALFVGWLHSINTYTTAERILLFVGFAGLEALVGAAAAAAMRNYNVYVRDFIAKQE